jgi:hypothetical protein
VVNRTIDGDTVRYVERLTKRANATTTAAWFVDCGTRYTGAAATVITGLDHLEGEAVTVVADGVCIHNPNDSTLASKVVSGGSITIASAATDVLVGLPFISDLETLDMDTASGQSVKESKNIVGRVIAMVEKSRGFAMGRAGTQTDGGADTLNNLQPYQEYASTTELITGDVDVPIESVHDTHGRVLIRQAAPMPCTVLAVIPVFGGGS